MADVIQIDQLRLERTHKGACQHKHLCYDYHNKYIECKDCGLPVQPFEAFMILVGNYNAAISSLQHRSQELAELEKRCDRNLLKAVRDIDHIWRGKMLPCCPHCGRGIAPEDGLGNSAVNKGIEMERRQFEGKGEKP